MSRRAAAVQTPAAKTSANPPSPSDARILLELVEKDAKGKENIGDRNLFQYRQAPPPPPISRAPVQALPGAAIAMPPTPVDDPDSYFTFACSTGSAADSAQVPGLRVDQRLRAGLHGFSGG